jgi:hypothetical protein
MSSITEQIANLKNTIKSARDVADAAYKLLMSVDSGEAVSVKPVYQLEREWQALEGIAVQAENDLILLQETLRNTQ